MNFIKNEQIYSWKFSVISKNPSQASNNFASSLIDNHPLPHAKFSGNCLRLSSNSLHQNAVNLYISYKLDWWPRYVTTYYILGNCLFGAVKLNQKLWSWKMWVDDSISVDFNFEKKDILDLLEGPTEGLDDATITVEPKYSINFTVRRKICV